MKALLYFCIFAPGLYTPVVKHDKDGRDCQDKMIDSRIYTIVGVNK